MALWINNSCSFVWRSNLVQGNFMNETSWVPLLVTSGSTRQIRWLTQNSCHLYLYLQRISEYFYWRCGKQIFLKMLSLRYDLGISSSLAKNVIPMFTWQKIYPREPFSSTWILNRGWQSTTCGPNPVCHLFFMAHELRIIFTDEHLQSIW